MKWRGSKILRGSVLALAWAVACPAAARSVRYEAKAGDTPESIAAEFYGNRALAVYIVEANGLGKESPLEPGQHVRVPTAFRYRVHKHDTLERLSRRFLDDKRRASFLGWVSGLKPGEKIHEGQELTIPFQLLHRAEAPESLQSIAKTFYGDPSRARLLADYNFRTSPVLAKGERILVPIAHVRIRSVFLGPEGVTEPMRAPPGSPTKQTEARELELAARVAGQIEQAERTNRDGNYAEVPAALDRLLTQEDPSEAQLAEIFRLKAFAYVALGQDELAVSAFREVLARKPNLVLEEATVSPKIRAAFDRARKAPSP